MPEIRFLESEKVRKELTIQQQRKIKKLYKESAERVREWEKRLEGKDNISSIIRAQYLKDMEKDLNEAMENVGRGVENGIKDNMHEMSKAVATESASILRGYGVSLSGLYSHVPDKIVSNVAMGRVYGGNWTLSKAIWKNTKKHNQEIHDIIAKGIAENKSSYDIAKELEKYVNPDAKKPWDWGKIYPGSRKVVDYNAQRLARTMVSHAYQQSMIETTKDNPFFEGYKWLIANNHKVCPICLGYAENVHEQGLPEGVFPKGDVPLDHPNGQCTLAVYTENSTDDIVKKLSNWARGGSNSELDKFAESLGFPISTVKNSINF